MIKLVIVITGLNTGGAEMMLLKLVERLSPQFSSEVISLTEIGEIGKLIQSSGIPVTALGMRRGIPNPILFWRLVLLLQRCRPDIVHTWMYHADLLGGIAAKLAKVPVLVWNIRNSDLSPRRTRLSTRLTAKFCARLSRLLPNKIQCCSSMARDIHISLGYAAEKFVIIPNGFDLQRFQPDRQARLSVRHEIGISHNAPLVGLVARFDPQKNHVGFIQAASALHQKRADVQFVLIGENVDHTNPELVAAVRQSQIDRFVHMLGFRADIPRLMAALDVFVSSSHGEAFPNVLGEAMACSVPCVVTDVGDSAYIVGNTGRVVAPGDMVGLAKSVEILLGLPEDKRQKLGRQARQRIQKNFEISHVVGTYEFLYQTLL
ncbi:MAG: glycosyltransferase [Cyanobacteria bacterium P01_D01_bin.56]